MKTNKYVWLLTAVFGKVLTIAILFIYNSFCCSNAQAQTTLNVWLTSGGVENYTFSESLTLAASSMTELTLTSKDIEVVYPVADIRKLTINDKEAERVAASVESTPQSNSEDTTVSVYNMSGTLVLTLEKDAKNTTQMDLKGLPAGIYIVKSKNSQFKVLVK